MPDPDAKSDRLADLAVRYLDGAATLEEFTELSAMLCGDALAARLFNDVCMTGRTLIEIGATHRTAGGEKADRALTPSGERTARVAGRIRASRAVYAIAAAILIAGASAVVHVVASRASLPAPHRDRPLVATVIDTRAVVWTSEPLQNGQELSIEPIEMATGFAEMLLRDGASVRVTGPARLTVAGNSRIELALGRIAVTGVPGFTVAGDGYSVVDLGTAFVVDAGAGRAATVWVTRGSVELRRDGGEPLVLKRGQTIARDSAGVWGEVRSDVLPPTDRDPVLWLAGDSGVKASAAGRVLEWSEPGFVDRDEAAVVAKPADTTASPIVTSSGALRFEERAGPLLTPLIDLGTSQTLAVAFTDAAPDEQPRQVLNTNGPPSVAIETFGSPRRVRVRLYAGKSLPASAIESDPIAKGRPVTVVFVADAEKGEMRLWVNGVMSQPTSLPYPIAQRSAKAIGGHPSGAARFVGDVAQVLIFDTALNEHDAAALGEWMLPPALPVADR